MDQVYLNTLYDNNIRLYLSMEQCKFTSLFEIFLILTFKATSDRRAQELNLCNNNFSFVEKDRNDLRKSHWGLLLPFVEINDKKSRNSKPLWELFCVRFGSKRLHS